METYLTAAEAITKFKEEGIFSVQLVDDFDSRKSIIENEFEYWMKGEVCNFKFHEEIEAHYSQYELFLDLSKSAEENHKNYKKQMKANI